jgi:hypothetical protein
MSTQTGCQDSYHCAGDNKQEQISMVGYTHAAEGGPLLSFSMRHCLASTAGLMPGADQNAEMLIAQLAQVA